MVTQIQMVYWKEENLVAYNAVLLTIFRESTVQAGLKQQLYVLFTDQLL